MPLPQRQSAAALILLSGLLFAAGSVLADSPDPADWLNRMGAAVQSTSYEGTVIRIRGGEAEALKVAHKVSEGLVQEKVVAQEGNGLEIIRNGNKVHCILPDRKSVLVEEWDDQSTLFSALPSSEIRFGNEYDVAIVREDRVAGRETQLLAIRPHDGYRYGYRIWLDTETAFPLQTQLIADDGTAVEQVKFAEIRLNQEIHASALEPSYSTEDYRWFNQPARHVTRSVETEWASADLPVGFRAISMHEEKMPGSEAFVTHILYSDGLANVSVFVAELAAGQSQGPSSVGGSNSYSAVIGDHHVTAVGEVPAMTVEQIATTMRAR
ncbi:MAG: MucB/RseB C-terminal domain-containing protein [Gammaproteobacteria bacterium]|nr:MucB/RseB C-terminal domain-containing protein [Gammaproteobacteria bacterium]